MERLIIPKDYETKLDVIETEKAIQLIRSRFEQRFAEEMNLLRVSSPLFVRPESGLNDNLSGAEKPVTFNVKRADNIPVEIVHSLAKWKRKALKNYGFTAGEGLYTDMNAIRAEEELGNLHSIYVDQWDWEKIITREDRNEQELESVVRKIYRVMKDTERFIAERYPEIAPILPEDISFITTQELEDRYPDMTAKERENAIAKEKKAVFISKIGGKLRSGEPHDMRSPDYDDWELNGDIVFWYPVLNKALELSSMGIRVDRSTLIKQLELSGCEDRMELEYHGMVLNNELPFTVGGGIGQSRFCMFMLRKAHIGEVQASVWSDAMVQQCAAAGIPLL
ncbi:aspartate--ammonia ligase [Atopococcus tabaci]|uniref:aspartate--ammonia ligase n=1 Tax=Atopococcus tabaci TaxID=269774 RepID=UPI00040A1D02|nr:aspartate--ammonia ligase [Atopococcus tabaci]